MPSKLGQQMNHLIRGQQQEATTGQSKATKIHNLYKQGLQQIRGTRNIHPDAQRVEIARLYTPTRQSLTKVKTDQAKTDQATFTKLERQLWGYDLERATAGDRASIDHTIRDAQDRAAKLTKADHATKALAQAEQAGDSILARAIAKRAHDMDWDDVLHDYLASRPQAAEKYQQAGAIWQRYNDTGAHMQDSMQYVVHKPDELRGLDDKAIQSMVDPEDSAA
ncbi:hypothetical protein [Streptomyces sp. WAC08401]|uniref:hypothetical protein n=1 Tax=Streptomyces sp. WAC08401 TaxID=2487413 RepID=UPI000FA84C36|nr:hypothetical protein [Streptomyces sp. WAC08401]RSS16637.1 hypothetical protein EF915_08735 [Streptomyces sp. WAC08401]